MYEWNAKCEYILTADIDGKHHRMISKRDSKKHKAIRDKGGVKMSVISI
jgi:very-short-patch-repair endonuclease